MSSGQRSRRRLRTLVLWAAPVAWLGCGGAGSTDIVLPSLSVTTATAGVELDPDGYGLTVDATAPQAMGLDANLTVEQLSEGAHTATLSGLAANCTAADNPRSFTVQAGVTTSVAFAITCSASSGTINVSTTTTGSNIDPDGFALTLDGTDHGPIGVNTSSSLAGLAPGTHTVGLTGVAVNCQVAGDNPQSLTVAGGQTSTAAFTVTCNTTGGGLSVTISGVPAGTPAAVDVTGPNSYAQALTETRTLTGLVPGSYTVNATNVSVGSISYLPKVDRPTVTVSSGATAAVTVTYAPPAGTPPNLRITALYITQSTQTLAGTVPLVQDRAAFVRVFALADQDNSARPTVQVSFFSGASLIGTLTLNRSGSSTPTALREGTLNNSWNGKVDASLIQPGVSILAEVDPGNTVLESNETDNSFPASGAPQALTVHAAPPVKIRFVPIQQGSAAPGNVTTANKDALIETARRIYPLRSIDTDVRAVYTTSIVLQPGGGDTWNQLLSDLEALRLMEAPDRTYYGVAKLAYQAGVVGLGFVGAPSAMGTDDPADVTRVVAHELGHTWNQSHTPCGNPPSIDPNYPYGTGIGVYGFDVTASNLKPPTTPDIMGYCSSPWISDYTYTRVMNFRETNAAVIQGASAAKQPALLVWGRIVNGRPVLEPAFQIVTRPSLPAKPGPYSVEGIATDGASLFRLSFDAIEVADDPSGGRHFAFAVPLDQARAARLGSLRLTGPAGAVTAASLQVATLRQGAAPDSIVARREPGRVALEWNPLVHPMIMVRDPDTGEILSFARGGNARVVTSKARLDLVASDGVQSRTIQVTPR